MMLVLLGVMLVMLTATVTFIGNQFSAGADQEQEERSFHVAEAGIHYVLFLLNQGVNTTEELVSQQELTQSVTEKGVTLGEFTVKISSIAGSQTSEAIQVVSSGRDASRNICQTVVVEIRRTGSHPAGPYEIASWDHAVTCGGYAS